MCYFLTILCVTVAFFDVENNCLAAAESHPMDGMRSMWEFVFISQFLRLFESKFGFVHFEAEVRKQKIIPPISH